MIFHKILLQQREVTLKIKIILIKGALYFRTNGFLEIKESNSFLSNTALKDGGKMFI